MSGSHASHGLPVAPPDGLDRLQAHVQSRLVGRLGSFRLVAHAGGLVLQGRTATYHAKQLAQQAVMEATSLRILSNEIEVVREAGRVPAV